MSEYLTMKEAILSGKTGDIVKDSESEFSFTIGKGNTPDIPWDVALRNEWEVQKGNICSECGKEYDPVHPSGICTKCWYEKKIKPLRNQEIGPKVLTDEESWEKSSYPLSQLRADARIKEAFKTGHRLGMPQGRLEMYLEFKKSFEKNKQSGNFQTFGFSQALENLKPLK